MRCTECREAVSARLDGEGSPDERAGVDGHLAGCADCRRWADRAAMVTRLARTQPVRPSPDLVAAVLTAAPAPRRPSRRIRLEIGLRLALAGLGVVQLWLAVGGVLVAGGHGERSGAEPTAAELGGATLLHLSHEGSAWNLALAVGFLWVAARAGRANALVPVVGAFVLVLVALSAVDLAHGGAVWSRELSHLGVVGLAILIVLGRLPERPVGGTPSGLHPVGVAAHADRL